ncbi:MAG: acyltransferase [Hymenobacter sp.]|nr:MAG: acyltransferase [Hymenobacter sp.]
MASLNYLWRNRVKHPVNSKEFYRVWGKRLFSFTELVLRNQQRIALVRRGAHIQETAEIGEVVINGNRKHLTIGAFSFLGKVAIDLHCPVKIGNRVCINDGVRILSASHDVSDAQWNLLRSEIVIEDFVWIGIGAIILPGVHLGKGAVVGAGAVVSKSVEPGRIVVGNPARPVLRTRPEQLDYNPCEFLAANRAWLVG